MTKIDLEIYDDAISALNKIREWYMKKPNVVLVADGQGMGWDSICISLHEDYSDFANFVRENEAELAELLIESQSFQVDLKPGVVVKPFHLKYLAKLAEMTQKK